MCPCPLAAAAYVDIAIFAVFGIASKVQFDFLTMAAAVPTLSRVRLGARLFEWAAAGWLWCSCLLTAAAHVSDARPERRSAMLF